MAAATTQQTQQSQGDMIIKQFSFPKGIVAGNQNPLDYPMDALFDGLNVDLIFGTIRTRRGWYYAHSRTVSDAPLPNAPVTGLWQVRYPTTQNAVLYAQCDDSLYMCEDNLPIINGHTHFYLMKDYVSNMGRLSLAQLNDRLVLTEGTAAVPQVTGGGTAEANWIFPKQVLFSRGVRAQTSLSDVIENWAWHDITDKVCDLDSSQIATIGGSVNAYIAVCLDIKEHYDIYLTIGTANAKTGSAVKFYTSVSGTFTEQSDWTDHTDRLFTSGRIHHTGEVETLEKGNLSGVEGFWVIFRVYSTDANPLTAGMSLDKVTYYPKYSALQNLSSGVPDIPASFVYVRSTGQVCDFTLDVSDYTIASYRELNDGNLSSPSGMGTSDYIYCGYPDRFSAVDWTFYPNLVNTNTSTLSMETWTGGGWTSTTINDLTATSGKSLNANGRVGWVPAAGWEMCDLSFAPIPIAYWVRFKVSAQISSRVGVAEIRVVPYTADISKYKLCFRFRDRVVLVASTAAPDSLAISRAFEEYGFSGEDNWEGRIGGADPIVAACELYNQGWLFRSNDLYMLNGYDPATFAVERAEIANQVPVNNQVLVKAPVLEADDRAKMGFYFLNHDGIWHFTGIQLYKMSDQLPYWDKQNGVPYLDHSLLYGACGVYWPSRDWIIFSVPMVLIADTSPGQNNRLLIYDLSLKAWLPPQAISVASLCVAYDYLASGAGKIGRPGLYGGTYDGNILKLFDEAAETDAGTDISCRWKTGWLDFGIPALRKRIMKIQVYAQTEATEITCKAYTDGDATNFTTQTFTRVGVVGDTKVFARDYGRRNLEGFFFQFEWSLPEFGIVYGVEYELGTRNWDDGDQ